MMKSLPRYIFSQTAVPCLMAGIVLTGIIWLTQTLKMLDLLITQGQTLGTFFQLSLLALPTAVNIVLPIALFSALLYGLNKLISDSELIVMFSAGVSRWTVAIPIVALTAIIMIVVTFLNVYAMPATMRELRAKLFEIRGDVATSLIREGAFNNPVVGLTIYVRSRTPEGGIRGIMVHDERDKMQPVTYVAETGELVRLPDGPRLIMYNGNIQRINRTHGKDATEPLTLLYFDKYTYDISQYTSSATAEPNESRERFLHELFDPAPDDYYGQVMKARLRAEGHDRLVAPLYPLMFAFIALAVLLPAPFNRRGYSARIAVGVLVAIVLRVIGFGLVNTAATQPFVIPLLYLLPLGACGVCMAIIGGVKFDHMFQRFIEWAERLPYIGAAPR